MLDIRKHIKYVILIYFIIAFVLYKLKPNLIFDKNKIKSFGVGTRKTIFNYYIILIFISILLFYLSELLWIKKNNFL